MSCRSLVGLVLLLLVFLGCQPEDKILLSDSQNPHVARGLARVRAMDHDEAIAAFERALEANPHSVRAHYELGLIFERHKKDYITAIYHYNQVLRYQKTGWPAENVRLLVAGCRQELVKAEALAPITRAMESELKTLRIKNRELTEELAALKNGIPVASAQRGPSGSGTGAATAAPKPDRDTTPSAQPKAEPKPPPVPVSGARFHRVKAGETLMQISRAYKVDINVLKAANPHIRPRSMPVGKVIKIPAR